MEREPGAAASRESPASSLYNIPGCAGRWVGDFRSPKRTKAVTERTTRLCEVARGADRNDFNVSGTGENDPLIRCAMCRRCCLPRAGREQHESKDTSNFHASGRTRPPMRNASLKSFKP